MEREKTVKTEKEEARRRYTPFTGFPNTAAPKIYSPKHIDPEQDQWPPGSSLLIFHTH
jgi:hypothetical protein